VGRAHLHVCDITQQVGCGLPATCSTPLHADAYVQRRTLNVTPVKQFTLGFLGVLTIQPRCVLRCWPTPLATLQCNKCQAAVSLNTRQADLQLQHLMACLPACLTFCRILVTPHCIHRTLWSTVSLPVCTHTQHTPEVNPDDAVGRP
jgi:hypothetical protein